MGCGSSSSAATVPSAAPVQLKSSANQTVVQQARVRDAGPTALKLFAVERKPGAPEPIEWMGRGERHDSAPDTDVHGLLRNPDATPEELYAVIHRNSHAAYERGHDGQYPLHIALQRKDGMDQLTNVLLALINPDAARRADLKGVWPIHKAILYGASDAVVLALIDACPDAVRCQGPYGDSTRQMVAERKMSPAIASAVLGAFDRARQVHDVSAVSGSRIGFSSSSFGDPAYEDGFSAPPPPTPPPPPMRPAVAGSPAASAGRKAPFPPPRSP